MRKIPFILILILAALIQVSWEPFFSWRGHTLPVVLLFLLFSALFYEVTEVLFFAFGSGIFLNLLGGGLLGSESLSLILAIICGQLVGNLFLRTRGFGFLLTVFSAVFVYEGILHLL